MNTHAGSTAFIGGPHAHNHKSEFDLSNQITKVPVQHRSPPIIFRFILSTPLFEQLDGCPMYRRIGPLKFMKFWCSRWNRWLRAHIRLTKFMQQWSVPIT
jgi:hypothetical protein